MDLKKIRIREDNYIDKTYEGYDCQECDIKFKDGDIVLEIDLYESRWRFCSEECLTKWIMSDVERKQIEVYPMPDKVKQKRELSELVGNMKPNTAITIGDMRIEYHKTKGLMEHYVVIGILERIFRYKHDVVNCLLNNL